MDIENKEIISGHLEPYQDNGTLAVIYYKRTDEQDASGHPEYAKREIFDTPEKATAFLQDNGVEA